MPMPGLYLTFVLQERFSNRLKCVNSPSRASFCPIQELCALSHSALNGFICSGKMFAENSRRGFQKIIRRDDADQLTVLDDWETADAMLAHQVYCVQRDS